MGLCAKDIFPPILFIFLHPPFTSCADVVDNVGGAPLGSLTKCEKRTTLEQSRCIIPVQVAVETDYICRITLSLSAGHAGSARRRQLP